MAIKSVLKAGAYQFKASADIEHNLEKILAGINIAQAEGLEIVAFHECALSGYPGVEIESVDGIDKNKLMRAEEVISESARNNKIDVVYGTTTFKEKSAYNSLVYIDSSGQRRALYSKRAMYGVDDLNYECGEIGGIVEHGKLTIGLRICFEFRFPEYFRELLVRNVDLAICSFSMVGKDNKKYQTAKAHLISRAAENGIYLLAVNNLNGVQNCPTCIIDPDGNILADAGDKEGLIATNINKPKSNPIRGQICKQARNLHPEYHS